MYHIFFFELEEKSNCSFLQWKCLKNEMERPWKSIYEWWINKKKKQ